MIMRSICIMALLAVTALSAAPASGSTAGPDPVPAEGSAQQRGDPVDAGAGDAAPGEAPGGLERGRDDVLLAETDQPVVYVPPRRGAPVTRVGGGTRSGEGTAPQVLLLSPEHTGLTSRAAPTLYWFLPRDYEGLVEIVVTARDAVHPLLRERVHTRLPAGFHQVDLADHGVSLDPDRLYQWSVSLVRDERRRSRDVVAVATIERVDATGVSPQVAELAGAGLWYDAIEVLGQAIPRLPDQRRTRADLLEQVGLSAAAEWDRRI